MLLVLNSMVSELIDQHVNKEHADLIVMLPDGNKLSEKFWRPNITRDVEGRYYSINIPKVVGNDVITITSADMKIYNSILIELFPNYALLEKPDNKKIYTKEEKEQVVRQMLEMIGDDPDRPGLVGTPDRIVRMWEEIYRGYNPENMPKITTFMNGVDGVHTDQMTTDVGDFYSNCEHHQLPFFGKYVFAYIPADSGKILGLSKVARVVDYHSAKMQIQERLVDDIISTLYGALTEGGYTPPLGMALIMKGEHLCKTMRGPKKKGHMTTTSLVGVFKTEEKVKSEFLSYANQELTKDR